MYATGVIPILQERGLQNANAAFDELAEDSRLSKPEYCFSLVNVFYKMLDIASNHIVQRLQPC